MVVIFRHVQKHFAIFRRELVCLGSQFLRAVPVTPNFYWM